MIISFCQNNDRACIDRAEQLLDAQPDSALSLLDQIDRPDRPEDDRKARQHTNRMLTERNLRLEIARRRGQEDKGDDTDIHGCHCLDLTVYTGDAVLLLVYIPIGI